MAVSIASGHSPENSPFQFLSCGLELGLPAGASVWAASSACCGEELHYKRCGSLGSWDGRISFLQMGLLSSSQSRRELV